MQASYSVPIATAYIANNVDSVAIVRLLMRIVMQLV